MIDPSKLWLPCDERLKLFVASLEPGIVVTAETLHEAYEGRILTLEAADRTKSTQLYVITGEGAKIIN